MKCRPAVGAATRARLPGVDRLVAVAVRGRVGAADVGRQGHVAVALERVSTSMPSRRRRTRRRGDAAAPPAAGGPASGPSMRRARPGPTSTTTPGRSRRPGRTMRLPEVVAEAPHEQDLGLAAARPAAEQAGGKDPAAVRDQEVAGAEELREIGEAAVRERAGRRGRARAAARRRARRAAPGRSSSAGSSKSYAPSAGPGGAGHGLRTASSGGWPGAAGTGRPRCS